MSFRWALIGPLVVATLRACSAPAPITTTSASALRDSVGVNLHLEYDATPYRNPASTLAAMRFLGVLNARDAALRNGAVSLQSFETVSRGGVRLNLFVNHDLETQVSLLERLAAVVSGSLATIEGPNEVNNEGYGGGAAGDSPRAQAYQARLYHAVHASIALSATPVLNFTDWPPRYGRADLANFHAYPSPKKPIAPQLALQRRLAAAVEPADMAVVCTETGFATEGAEPLDEELQAELEPILLLENFRAGVRTTYLYELYDELSGAQTRDSSAGWGLFRFDGSPKPAAFALRRMLTLLAPARVQPGNRRPAGWATLSGSDLRTLRVDRDDGVRLTFAWWADAQARPLRPIGITTAAGGRIVDLATGRETPLTAARLKVETGASPIVVVQPPASPMRVGRA